MNTRINTSASSNNKNEDKKRPKSSQCDLKKPKCATSREKVINKRRMNKNSMIPRLKSDTKGIHQKQKQLSAIISNESKTLVEEDDKCVKSVLPASTLTSIDKYYIQIEELMEKILVNKEKEKEAVTKTFQEEISPRKMTSDPLIFNKNAKNEVFTDFEKNVKQISEIWLRTSNDLSDILKNLKNNPNLDPIEFEVESVKIQLAIKQAKSLTLVKTRNVIAEAKKLMLSKEAIRTELEKLLLSEKLRMAKNEIPKNIFSKERQKLVSKQESTGKEREDGSTGDKEKKDSKVLSAKKPKTKDGGNIVREIEIQESFSEVSPRKNEVMENCEKSQFPETVKQCVKKSQSVLIADAEELSKKNETIAQLNNRIFELQKACDEHSLKFNELQLKILQFQEKIQWDKVLWKQIGKLKERIKGLQQSNKQLEMQKKDLETKISKMNSELERLVQLNQVLNKKNYLLSQEDKLSYVGSSESGSGEDANRKHSKDVRSKDLELESDGVAKILAEKENVINHLKNILDMMRDQENVAQKQIAAFESKIKELQKKEI